MRRTPVRSGLPILLVWSSSLLAGCSTFNRDWEAMDQAAEVASGIEDRWEGTWLSDANGHTGALRCILATDEVGTLNARYRARYGGCFSFEYTVPMAVWRDGEVYRFSGEADLGLLAGGRYEYEGTVVGDAFTSTYTSARDHGTFQMTRVGSSD
jgi:hypothetical protein